jgi:hypothetical protein
MQCAVQRTQQFSLIGQCSHGRASEQMSVLRNQIRCASQLAVVCMVQQGKMPGLKRSRDDSAILAGSSGHEQCVIWIVISAVVQAMPQAHHPITSLGSTQLPLSRHTIGAVSIHTNKQQSTSSGTLH